jgi:hypothetical protein
MKRLVKRISLPLLLLAGLSLIGPQTAEAAGWRRYVPRPYVRQPYYVAPVAVVAAPVRVYAPGVGVYVGPGVRVRAPGVRVNVGSPYPLYRNSYYFGW